jgi:hypothetical protein
MTRARTVGIPRRRGPPPGSGRDPARPGAGASVACRRCARREGPACRRGPAPPEGLAPGFRRSYGALAAAPAPSPAGAVGRGLPFAPGPCAARPRAPGDGRPPPSRVLGASPRASRRRRRDPRVGPRAGVPGAGRGARRRSCSPPADGCPPVGTPRGRPSLRPVASAPRVRRVPVRPSPPPRHRRGPAARGLRTPTRPRPPSAASPAARGPRVGRVPPASVSAPRTVGPRAVRLGVPGREAAQGLPPSRPFLGGVRRPVARAMTARRARPGVQRDREGPHDLSPPTPLDRRGTSPAGRGGESAIRPPMEARQAQPVAGAPGARDRQRWAAAQAPRPMRGLARVPGQGPAHPTAMPLAIPPPTPRLAAVAAPPTSAPGV